MIYKRYYPKFMDIDASGREEIEFTTVAELRPRIYIPDSTKSHELVFYRHHPDQIVVSVHYGPDEYWVRGFIFGTREELDTVATFVTYMPIQTVSGSK